jgi:hypothetical protein
MCAAELFRQQPKFSVDLAEIFCEKLATLGVKKVSSVLCTVLGAHEPVLLYKLNNLL